MQLDTIEGFRKVLNSLNKEDLVDILDKLEAEKDGETPFSTSGKKEKLVENILKNSTFLELTIKQIVRESYKDDLIEMCEHLGIESDGSTSELKQQILQKLDETIDNKDLQKQIKFLNVAISCSEFLDKEDLVEILEANDLPTSGKKSELIELIAKNDSVMEDVFNDWKGESGKDEIKEWCEGVGIKSDGIRKDLETRLEDYLFKKEKISTKYNKPQIDSEREYSLSKTKIDVSDEDLKNNFENYTWRDMEEVVGELYKKQGYEVTITPGARDFGIDVWAITPNEKIGIQVKHQTNDVGFDAVAKTVGCAMGANKVIIVSTKSGFSKQVYQYQMDNQQFVELWTSKRLKQKIRYHLFGNS